jgi:hypothetical protein
MKMKKIILGTLLVIVLVSGLLLPGCIRRDLSEKNGPIQTQTYDFTGFTGIEIGSAMKLDVVYGDSYNVTITAGQNLFKNIKVDKSGDTLRIYTEGWSFSWWWGQTTPKVEITMPVLEKIELSGAVDGMVSGFESARNLELKVSGASSLDMDVETSFLEANISGASDVKGRMVAVGSHIVISGASTVNFTGSGGDLYLQGSGASTLALKYYTANDADVELSGASNGSIDVSGRLDVVLSGASSLNYYGDPELGHSSVTGASDLNHKN